jgi:hypothetical protein
MTEEDKMDENTENDKIDENDMFDQKGFNVDENIVELSKTDKEFITKNIGLKQEVYNIIIISSKNKPNNSTALNDYVLSLRYIYELLKNMPDCKENECDKILYNKINSIPDKHAYIRSILVKLTTPILDRILWMKSFFIKNNITDNIPYNHQLLSCYIEYPYDFSYKSLLPD